MEKSKQPGVSFDAVLLKALHFERDPQVLERPNLDLNFAPSASIAPDGKNLSLELSVTIKEKDKSSFNLSATMIGFFSVLEGQGNMSLEEFSKVNAPALIFPYLRELIADITLRSGLKPIIFPPINVVALMSAKQAQQAVTQESTK